MTTKKSGAITPSPDPRLVRATYQAGFFTNGVWDMLSIAVPLYGAAIGLSPADIGFIVAARSLLPTLLSIHGGILMDYWGTRRVITWVAIACAFLPLLYPLAGYFLPLLILQLLLGLASSLGMAASQTWSLQTSLDTATLARFSLYSRIGTFIAPILIGAVWDFLGAWPAFVCIAAWAAGTVAAAARAPENPGQTPISAEKPGQTRVSEKNPGLSPISVLVPRWHAHRHALALAAIPAVAFVLAVSFLRNAPGAVQSSLYVFYLGEVGLSGTSIGALVGICELFGVAGSMLAAPLERFMRAPMLVVLCIAASVTAIAATPLLASAFALLAIAAAIRGTAQGLSQPLMYALLGKAVPAAAHGASVGVRNAVTRLASIVTPALMGIAAEAWGIEASFYAVGVFLLAGTAALALAARALQKHSAGTAAPT